MATQKSWWKRIPAVSAAGRLVHYSGRGVVLTGRLGRMIIFDHPDEEWWDDFLEWWGDGINAYNDAVEVITYSLIVAAAIGLGQVQTAIAAGKFDVILKSRIVTNLGAVWGAWEYVKSRFDTELERIKGHLDWEAIQVGLDQLKIVHNVGLTFSATYRESVEDFYRNTADLSRQVFGPSNSLFHGLSLLQLVVNDSTRLQGGTAAEGQANYLSKAVSVSERVARRSRAYAKDGSLFWSDFQIVYLQPLIDEQYKRHVERDSLIGRIDTTATQADEAVVGLSDSFRDYRDHLAPFLSDENRENLRQIQQGFDRDIRRPVERFQGFMETTFPDIQENVVQLAKDDQILAEGLMESLDRTAYPGSLTEEQRASQGLRINSIMDSAFVRGDGAPRSIQRDMTIVRSIYDILEAR